MRDLLSPARYRPLGTGDLSPAKRCHVKIKVACVGIFVGRERVRGSGEASVPGRVYGKRGTGSWKGPKKPFGHFQTWIRQFHYRLGFPQFFALGIGFWKTPKENPLGFPSRGSKAFGGI